ncbi:MAG TPA: DUF4350 domain-containing protein, partial [Pyrinomonadaceae bacterium]|nr:DUF4350 domain-containing protein [Pyrinomonadaceae bacterium]
MRQKFLIFTALIFLTIALVGLNAASYVQKEKTPDNEANPNRSTYNAGATGTRAFYELLAETGRPVSRWQESPSALLVNDKNQPRTFVIVGAVRRKFDDKEIEQLLRWVSEGGKLVIIDREPPAELTKTTANWSVSVNPEIEPSFFGINPSDQKQMTDKIVAAKPTQPTVYTNKVNAVQPSRFASSINFERFSDENNSTSNNHVFALPNPTVNDYDEDAPPPKPAPSGYETGGGIVTNKSQSPETIIEKESEALETAALAAPVAHLANNEKTLLVDFPFGSGQIVF